jgi:hypothetical protein
MGMCQQPAGRVYHTKEDISRPRPARTDLACFFGRLDYSPSDCETKCIIWKAGFEGLRKYEQEILGKVIRWSRLSEVSAISVRILNWSTLRHTATPNYLCKYELRFVAAVATCRPPVEKDQLTKTISNVRLAMMALPFYGDLFSDQYLRFDISASQEAIHNLAHLE